MPRTARNLMGGFAYHILNRANGRTTLFRKPGDFEAFEEIIRQAHERVPLRILGYVVMCNHWHFVVWPRREQGSQITDFFRWLSITHAQRWHAHHGTTGTGHVYQGRFKSFPVAGDDHLLSVLRYVERNPLRAKLVGQAEDWRYGSLHRRLYGTTEQKKLLSDSPVPLGRDWAAHVNRPQSDAEITAIQSSLLRGRPYGTEQWQQRAANQLDLHHTFRPRGRPKKQPPPKS